MWTDGRPITPKRVGFAYNLRDQFTGITRYADAAGTEDIVHSGNTYDAAGRLDTLTHTDVEGLDVVRASYNLDYSGMHRLASVQSLVDGLTSFQTRRMGRHRQPIEPSYWSTNWASIGVDG